VYVCFRALILECEPKKDAHNNKKNAHENEKTARDQFLHSTAPERAHFFSLRHDNRSVKISPIITTPNFFLKISTARPTRDSLSTPKSEDYRSSR